MSAIEVYPAGNQVYDVEVRDDAGTSRHEVTLPDDLLAQLDTEDVAAKDLVMAAVAFLSSREGTHQELDERIDLGEMADRYQGFTERVSDLARQRRLHDVSGDGDPPSDEPSGDERLVREVKQEQAEGQASQGTEPR